MEQQIHPQLLERLLLLSEAQQLKVAQWIKSTFGKSEHRMTVEEYNRDLEEAEADVLRGDVLTHEEAIQQMRQWGIKHLD